MKHGCHNRLPLSHVAHVQTGWEYCGQSRTPAMQWIRDPMTKECQYSKSKTDDPRCAGCEHHSDLVSVAFPF